MSDLLNPSSGVSEDSVTGKPTPNKSTGGASHTSPEQLANERNIGTSNQYGVGVPECNYSVVDEADGVAIAVSSGNPALLFGFYVNEVLAGATIILQDGATPVIIIPAGGEADVGSFIPLPGIKFNISLVCNCEAGLTTGNITLCWRPQ